MQRNRILVTLLAGLMILFIGGFLALTRSASASMPSGNAVDAVGSRSQAPLGAVTPPCATAAPVPVVTPAFTPGPGCSATPSAGVLEATISTVGGQTQAVFINHSTTCSYPIGLATYQRFDNNIDNQGSTTMRWR